MNIPLYHRLRTWFFIRGNQFLPLIVRMLRPFRRPVVTAYKDRGAWYVRDFNGFSKAANQLVAGIPELIELWTGSDATEVRLHYSDRPFAEARDLDLLSTDPSGSTYQWFDGHRPHLGWLCPVFFWYFRQAPEHLYVRAETRRRHCGTEQALWDC